MMLEFVQKLFDTRDFPARWNCGNWTEGHGWLHIVSDLGIWSAYIAIPCVLVFFALRRRDIPFRTVFLLFGAFILACGTTHLMEALIFWWPAYRLAGVIKLFTAIVSWGTVIALIPATPLALSLRSPSELQRQTAQRERAEEALRRSNQMLQALVQASPVAIMTVDAQGRVVLWNAAAEQIFGWKAEETIGRPPPMFLDPAISEEESAANRAVAERESSRDEELRCWRKGGGRVDVSMSLAPLSGMAEGPVGSVALFSDITERKRAEEARRRLTSIVENSDDAIIAQSVEGIILSWNRGAERLFGYTEEETFGKAVSLLIPFERSAELPHLLDKVKAGVSVRNYETQRRHKSGRLVDVSISLSPLFDAAGRLVGASKIIRDISHGKQLQEKIQHAQKLESLGVLAGGIAHDFNNLLMGILGGADLALMEMPPEAPARESIEIIQRSAVRAAELCHQMLAYSGKGRFVVKPIDLSELVEEMGHLLDVCVSKKAVLNYRLEKNLPAIDADATQIRQVVMNLITNASESIGDSNGTVTVATGLMEADEAFLRETYLNDDLRPGKYAYVEVSDTGSGMDEETRSRIFDPFFTTKFTGRGLGLAAVLGIVRGHRGAVKIESERGRGTTMRVLFPCSAEGAAPVPEFEMASGGSWHANGKVLVVDDDETVRAVAKRMLEGCGFEVITANDGLEGVAEYRRHQEELILVVLDMTMPHMDGDETFREIRRIRPDARVILSSGYNEQDAINRFAGRGLAGFIQKPYRSGQLLAKVKEILTGESAEGRGGEDAGSMKRPAK